MISDTNNPSKMLEGKRTQYSFRPKENPFRKKILIRSRIDFQRPVNFSSEGLLRCVRDVRRKQRATVGHRRHQGGELDRRDFEVVSMRRHVIDGEAGFGLRQASLKLISNIDAGFFTQSQLPGVRDHLVKTNAATYCLEILVFGVSQRVGEIDAVRIRDSGCVAGIDYSFIEPRQTRDQLDSRARLKAFP